MHLIIELMHCGLAVYKPHVCICDAAEWVVFLLFFFFCFVCLHQCRFAHTHTACSLSLLAHSIVWISSNLKKEKKNQDLQIANSSNRNSVYERKLLYFVNCLINVLNFVKWQNCFILEFLTEKEIKKKSFKEISTGFHRHFKFANSFLFFRMQFSSRSPFEIDVKVFLTGTKFRFDI